MATEHFQVSSKSMQTELCVKVQPQHKANGHMLLKEKKRRGLGKGLVEFYGM